MGFDKCSDAPAAGGVGTWDDEERLTDGHGEYISLLWPVDVVRK